MKKKVIDTTLSSKKKKNTKNKNTKSKNKKTKIILNTKKKKNQKVQYYYHFEKKIHKKQKNNWKTLFLLGTLVLLTSFFLIIIFQESCTFCKKIINFITKKDTPLETMKITTISGTSPLKLNKNFNQFNNKNIIRSNTWIKKENIDITNTINRTNLIDTLKDKDFSFFNLLYNNFLITQKVMLKQEKRNFLITDMKGNPCFSKFKKRGKFLFLVKELLFLKRNKTTKQLSSYFINDDKELKFKQLPLFLKQKKVLSNSDNNLYFSNLLSFSERIITLVNQNINIFLQVQTEQPKVFYTFNRKGSLKKNIKTNLLSYINFQLPFLHSTIDEYLQQLLNDYNCPQDKELYNQLFVILEYIIKISSFNLYNQFLQEQITKKNTQLIFFPIFFLELLELFLIDSIVHFNTDKKIQLETENLTLKKFLEFVNQQTKQDFFLKQQDLNNEQQITLQCFSKEYQKHLLSTKNYDNLISIDFLNLELFKKNNFSFIYLLTPEQITNLKTTLSLQENDNELFSKYNNNEGLIILNKKIYEKQKTNFILNSTENKIKTEILYKELGKVVNFNSGNNSLFKRLIDLQSLKKNASIFFKPQLDTLKSFFITYKKNFNRINTSFDIDKNATTTENKSNFLNLNIIDNKEQFSQLLQLNKTIKLEDNYSSLLEIFQYYQNITLEQYNYYLINNLKLLPEEKYYINFLKKEKKNTKILVIDFLEFLTNFENLALFYNKITDKFSITLLVPFFFLKLPFILNLMKKEIPYFKEPTKEDKNVYLFTFSIENFFNKLDQKNENSINTYQLKKLLQQLIINNNFFKNKNFLNNIKTNNEKLLSTTQIELQLEKFIILPLQQLNNSLLLKNFNEDEIKKDIIFQDKKKEIMEDLDSCFSISNSKTTYLANGKLQTFYDERKKEHNFTTHHDNFFNSGIYEHSLKYSSVLTPNIIKEKKFLVKINSYFLSNEKNEENNYLFIKKLFENKKDFCLHLSCEYEKLNTTLVRLIFHEFSSNHITFLYLYNIIGEGYFIISLNKIDEKI